MQRINDREVELTEQELRASYMFERMLDKGHSLKVAANRVAVRFHMVDQRLSPEFLRYLVG